MKELLSPAGNIECLKAAINNGADACYLGGKSFGARAFAGNFTNEELKEIFKGMLNKAGFKISKTTLNCLDSIIDIERAKDNFGNARFIRNLYEKTIIKHATNTKNIKDKNKLITITEEDIK